MDFLKQQISEKLKNLPKTALQQALEFVTFLEWRKNNNNQLSSLAKEELSEDDENGSIPNV